VDTTIFEYAGGREAMLRLAEAHYRRCLTDPVLAEVFGGRERPEHVAHLADWLSEVFGGPGYYTDLHGGHGALLRHHAGLNITEPQRERFVTAFMESVDEAELPDDPALRERLRAYVEWGTRVAVGVSQPGADTDSTDPVPRWGWS
jgi:hemoglobin